MRQPPCPPSHPPPASAMLDGYSTRGRKHSDVLAVPDFDRSLTDAARRPAFAVRVTGVRLLGRGVAFDLRSPELDAVHTRLRAQWESHLTRQDAQPLSAHVTVQNKAHPDAAWGLHAHLAADFEAYDVGATGLALWRYRGGPWEPVSRRPFG